MDLHALSLDLRERRAHLRAADADGVHEAELTGGAYERVMAAAQPLFDWAHGRVPASGRTPCDSTLVAFEVDALARTIDLAYVAERARIEGAPSQSSPGLAWCRGDYDALHSLLREAGRIALRELRPRTADPPGLAPDSRWEHIYQHGGDGWELGRAAPPLVRFLTAHPGLLGPGDRALVIGSGRGNDALALARLAAPVAARVVAIDIAPSAVRITAEAAVAAGLAGCLDSRQADLLDPGDREPLANGSYDLILEHTCFCAIEPSRRAEYAEAVGRLLKPGGHLVGLFYCHGYPGGPPYGSTPDEIRRLLDPLFTIEHAEVPGDSVLTRAGVEWLVLARRR